MRISDWSSDVCSSDLRITNRTLALLQDLARDAALDSWIARMFAGEAVNQTEGRPALHVALRNRTNEPIAVSGPDVMPAIGRTSCGARACKYVLISVVAVSLKTKTLICKNT